MVEEAKAPETKAPKGFKVVAYPNLLTLQDDTLYVCETCVPAWDTFNLDEAVAHTAADLHNPEAQLWRVGATT